MEKIQQMKYIFFKTKQQEPDEPKYRCINCSHPLKELYKTYSPTIQKLVECDKCNKIADNLIEFDNLYIIINLILLSTEAQRHVLYNTTCKNLYKILMIIIMLESYFIWNEVTEKSEINLNNDPLFMEKGFYLSTLQIASSNLTFFIIIRIISCWAEDKMYRTKNLTLDLLRGFMLASIAKFFFLPIIIWSDNISGLNRSTHLTLVIGYFLISLIYIHSTITGCTRKISASAILLSFIINKYIWLHLNFKNIF
ncbi:hypothetical protein PVAND_000547 [Polypedilum vanderplanki]|uniref:Protein ARV n=1 Tax=Polypedilum vanderplanki TaxID=319348 RepID=A0A9J6BLL7_POLVA|nr:hypothetical protein PVAND_000547 [Polypedilum vanderplanki]